MLSALRSGLQRAAAAAAAPRHTALYATGPAVGGHVSDEMLEKLGKLSTQALIDGLWVMGWPTSHIEGARPLGPGMKMSGRAVTMRFVPQRPDIAADKPPGMESPEYEAFEAAGPKEVVVMSAVGPWESVGGDIKFLRLAQRKVGGLVTDGSVRDTDTVLEYGFPCFSYSTTPRQGPHTQQPWECNGVINCGGVTVRPGDAVVGDQDGVVVIPAAVADKVYEIAHSREEIEEIVKAQLIEEKCPPGKYYPFMSGKIKTDSPLGKLLTSKGVKFYSTGTGAAPRAAPAGAVGASRFGGSTRRSAAPGMRRSYSTVAARPQAEYDAVLKEFATHKACAVLRTNLADFVEPAMGAAVEGGFKIVEFTLTTPGCLDLVSKFAPRSDVMVGCGTILNVEDAENAMKAGSQFIVLPVTVPEVITWCKERNIVCIPGCATPTELLNAWKMGAPVQKLFPGVAGGPGWVKAVSSALPMLRINPTSGVEKSTAVEFLQNGAASLGFVAPAFPPDLMAARDYQGLVKNNAEIIAEVKKAL